MIRFSAEAIFASSTSKSGVRIPLIEGKCEQVHTSVLNHIFQQANVSDVGNFVKMRIWNLQSLLVCLTRDEWISGWRSGLASRIQRWCLAFTHHMWWCVFWYIRDPRIGLLPDKVLKKMPLDLQKRFPIYPACPKYLAALRCGSAFPENGSAFRKDLEKVGKTQVDW